MTHPFGEIQVCEGVVLTSEFLGQTMLKSAHSYHRHPNGGGWVADNSYVPYRICIPPSLTIGPNTRVLDGGNLAGQVYVSGEFTNAAQVSRAMTSEDRLLLMDMRSLDVA